MGNAGLSKAQEMVESRSVVTLAVQPTSIERRHPYRERTKQYCANRVKLQSGTISHISDCRAIRQLTYKKEQLRNCKETTTVSQDSSRILDVGL